MGERIEVVITELEQTARPDLPPAPLPRGVKTAILKVERPAVHFYRYLYDTVGRPYHWVSRRKLTNGQLAEIIHAPTNHLYTLIVDGAPGGLAELGVEGDGDFLLSFFGLTPERIGRGLGRYFLTNAIDLAWDLGARRLRVETCTLDHPAALPLYQKLGFSVVGQRKGLVDTSIERAEG
ncbi:MAG: GNAT family N-acetyltransferase [Pseudomonadota bacterium]